MSSWREPAYRVLFRKSLYITLSWEVLPAFSSSSSRFQGFTLRSLIQMELNFVQGERLGPSLILLCIDINGYAVLFFSPAYNKKSGGSSCMDFYFSGSSIPFYVCLCASPTTILELKFRCDNTSNINLFFFVPTPWGLPGSSGLWTSICSLRYYIMNTITICQYATLLSIYLLVEYLNFSYWDWRYN